MKNKVLLSTLICVFFLSSSILAQSGEKKKEDELPFKNDPFFNKKIEELLGIQQNEETEKPSSDSTHNSKFRFEYLSQNGIDIGGVLEAGPYNSNTLYSTYPNLPMIHFNRVDALFLGIRKERMQWYENDWFLGIPNVQTHGMLGYSFGQNEWQYTLGLEKYFGRNDHVIVGGEYHSATTTDDYWRVGLSETSFTSFFAGYDYLDYYKQRGWGAYILFRTSRMFEGGIAYSNDRLNSQQQETDWAFFGSGNRYRPNPPVDLINGAPVDTIDIASVTLSASYNPKRLLVSRNFTLSLNGTVELGDTDIAGSEYSFNKYLGEMITYINFEPGGVFKHRLKVGAITGDAPLVKEFQLGGVGSLRALPYKSLSPGNQMILSNAEMQFGKTIGSTSDWIDFDQVYLSIFLDSGWAAFEEELIESNSPFDGFSNFAFADLKHNAGIGIGSSSIRAELAWDLNNTSRAPVFWLRFNPTF